MRQYILKSANRNGVKYITRKAIENKKQWVVEVYFDDRPYPNIISGRYKRFKDARDAISDYQCEENKGKFCFWGNV